jgi:hypothetical protein
MNDAVWIKLGRLGSHSGLFPVPDIQVIFSHMMSPCGAGPAPMALNCVSARKDRAGSRFIPSLILLSAARCSEFRRAPALDDNLIERANSDVRDRTRKAPKKYAAA